MTTSSVRCYWFALLTMPALYACDDEPVAKPRPTFEADAGSGYRDAKVTREGPQYAVVSSDWSASSVSLLDLAGKVVADDYVHSGSTESGLVTTISGDVDLPTQSGEQGVLVLIDRFKSDVITRIRLSDGEVLGQLKTHTPAEQDTTSAFSSNPQDYVRIDEHTAWVTRSQTNLDPSAQEIDRGDDLLRIDPSSMERTDERIDLSALRGRATRTDPQTGQDEEVELYAQPTRMARAGDTLIVGLGLAAYDFSAVGPGTVAVIDLESRKVEALELEGLKGCTRVSPVPGTTDRVLVGCSGDYSQPGESEGVAIVRVSGGNASIEKSWKLSDHADGPALSGSFAALDASTITAAANSFVGAEADSVFGVVDLDSGAFTELLSIPAGGGTFGIPLFDADTQKLFVPDARLDSDMRPTAGVHIFDRDAEGLHEAELVKVAQDTALPARYVYPLSAAAR